MPRQDTSFPTKFGLILKIEDLCNYTDIITSNENYFKRCLRNTIVKRMQNSAYDLLRYATKANSLLIDSKHDAPERLLNERLTIAECDFFVSLINMALKSKSCAIGKKRADFWAEKIRIIKRSAYNWYQSDLSRAKKFLFL